MISYIIKRMLLAIPTLLVVSFLLFMLLYMGPNPLDQLKQNPNISPEDIARLTKQFGFDKPWYEQYFGWLSGLLHGDLGTSLATFRPAGELIAERLPVTLMLTGTSMIVSFMIAIPIATYVAVHKYSKADYAATFLTFAMMAAPSFFLALLLQLLAVKSQDWFGGTLVFATGGAPASYWDMLEVMRHMFLPVLALSMLQIAGWSRYHRSEMLQVLGSDYVKCATAKGMPNRHVLMAHAMRNALLPIITIVAIDIATLFSGAVITESIFGLAGMGTLLLDSVFAKDTIVVLDIIMISAFLMVTMNTIADVLYGVFDPRVTVK